MLVEYLPIIFKFCLIPLLGVATKWLVSFIDAKVEETKAKVESDKTKDYIELLGQVVQDCVVATNQTYVQSLKDQNAFDEEAQLIAFEKTAAAVTSILGGAVTDHLCNVVGDFGELLKEKIEAEVQRQKTQ